VGLTAALALLRTHVLVVAVPGGTMLRLRAEAAVRARGWLLVDAPEDADLLLVCGAPGRVAAAAVDGLWRRVPAPRARRTVAVAEELDRVLDSAARVLADGALQRRTAAATPRAPAPAPPAGTVRFGPVARDWPPGVVVDCRLDRRGRVEGVESRLLPVGPADDGGDDAVRAFALDVAAAAGILRLAGWPAPAARLDRVLDRVLAGGPPAAERPAVARVRALVDRSVTARWGLDRAAPRAGVRGRLLELLAEPGRERSEWRPGRALEGLVGRRPVEVPLRVAAAGWEQVDA
jgi:hypothetical protein